MFKSYERLTNFQVCTTELSSSLVTDSHGRVKEGRVRLGVYGRVQFKIQITLARGWRTLAHNEHRIASTHGIWQRNGGTTSGLGREARGISGRRAANVRIGRATSDVMDVSRVREALRKVSNLRVGFGEHNYCTQLVYRAANSVFDSGPGSLLAALRDRSSPGEGRVDHVTPTPVLQKARRKG